MQYRKFGNLDVNVSALGFGAMRLPVKAGCKALMGPDIDEAEAIAMMRHAMDCGVNYVDTAYPYHGGNSEVVVGKALQDGYRKKVSLATKMPSWLANDYADFDRIFNEQLKRLQTDHIDFYLLHALNRDHWPKVRDLDVLEWAQKRMDIGQIGHLGFSFHDNLENFKIIVDGCDLWSFCQIQYNFMDVEYQTGTVGLQYAAKKGLAIVIMEPLRGGQLAKKPPAVVQEILTANGITQTLADLALKWVWNQPEVSLLLSGMTHMDHVIENVESAKHSGIGTLLAKELAVVDQLRDQYRALSPIPCTNCQYCLPCPNGVDIPHAFGQYNDSTMYADARTARFRYQMKAKETWADNCIECKECEEKCPQQIPIVDWLKKAHAWLGPQKRS
jgi:uncharacterized protein